MAEPALIRAPSVEASVLLVDDRPANLLALEAILEPLGCELVRAQSGQEALREVLHRDFAVLLIDVMMPDIDGFETAALIKSRPATRDIPIIFLTATSLDAKRVIQSYARGGVDLMMKPFEPEILRSKVAVFVELFLKNQELKRQAELLRRREREARENRQLYEAERGARAQAEAFARAREEILAIVSHDLRDPMSTVSASAAMIARKLELGQSHPAELGRYTSSIQRAITRMDRLVSDLLDITRIEAGRLHVDCDLVPVDEIIGQAVELIRPLAAQKQQTVQVSASERSIAFCDRDRVAQVLGNLLGNAVKFTPPAGRIEVSAQVDSPHVEIRIRDTGPGIAADAQAQIFERYWQASQHRRRGVGLGLAIAHGIVAAHGGRIWVESELGAGSCFCFTLPASDPARHGEA